MKPLWFRNLYETEGLLLQSQIVIIRRCCSAPGHKKTPPTPDVWVIWWRTEYGGNSHPLGSFNKRWENVNRACLSSVVIQNTAQMLQALTWDRHIHTAIFIINQGSGVQRIWLCNEVCAATARRHFLTRCMEKEMFRYELSWGDWRAKIVFIYMYWKASGYDGLHIP